MFFPQSWRELLDLTVRVDRYTLQDIGQIYVRIDIVQLAGADQTLDNADLFCAQLGPAE